MSSAIRSHGFTALGPLHEALAKLVGWRALGFAALLGAFSALASHLPSSFPSPVSSG